MSENSASKKNAFSKKMSDILNHGALNLAMAIGYRTGLFDAMDTFDSPRSIADIAGKAGMNSRYVTEWMGVMATGGIVELAKAENGENLFYLPKEHADFITRRSGESNLGVYTREIPLLTDCALEPVVDGFKTGDGVPYEKYPKFQSFMGQLADAKHRKTLVDNFLPSVDNGLLIRRLKSGIRVCDVGCAEGVALLLMAEAFPESAFTGIDISGEAVRKARKEAGRREIENVEFEIADIVSMPSDRAFHGRYDYVTAFDAIHDQTKPLEALKAIKIILAPGGIFSMVDIATESDLSDNLDHPMGPFLYTVSLMHCMPVGLVGGGTGLGMMWGREKAVEMLRRAGFGHTEVLEIPDDPFNLHFLCRNTDSPNQ